jgi:hypothetical protein
MWSACDEWDLLERKRQLKNKQTTAGWCMALGLLAGATSGCLSDADVDDWALSGIDGERVDVGLASEGEESDEFGTLAAPLRQTGSPTYVGFPAAHLTTAQEAFAIVRSRIWNTTSSGQFLSSMKNSIMSATFTYPEQMLAFLRRDVPTRIEYLTGCVDPDTGKPKCCGLGHAAPAETIYMDDCTFNYADSRQTNEGIPNENIIADALIHELTHTSGPFLLPRGNGHPGPEEVVNGTGDCPGGCIERQMAVTNVVSSSLFDTTPMDWNYGTAPNFIPDRSVMATQTSEITLAPVGTFYNTQQPAENHCFIPEKGIGIVGRSGSSVDALGMYCRDGSGVEGANAPTGASTGTAFQYKCPANEVLVGLRGTAGWWIHSVQPICALSAAVAAGGYSSNVSPPSFGAAGAHAFERLCPPFQIVKGTRLRTNDVVRTIDVLCQRHDSLRDAYTTGATRLGGTGGDTIDDDHCPSRSVMDKLWGVGDDVDNRLHRLGAGCAKVSNTCQGCQITVSSSSNNVNHMTPFRGFQPIEGTGIGRTGACSGTDSVLVGLTTWTSAGSVRAVRGTCAASASLWSIGSSTVTTTTAQVGTPPAGSTQQSFTCPSRSFLTGWRMAEGPNLMSITPRCRTF